MNRLAPLLLAFVLGLAVPPLAAQSAVDPASVPPRPRAANDASEYRRLVLPNGIRVILLSDPRLNVSSAALAVGVGNYSDPPARQGLAHFLEHMLFLGTAKYPDITDYSGFLRRNNGASNAYTAGDRTNYHFEVRHEAFDGALDRFAQFFIAPLFDPRFTEREMNAVNSEHQKNLESDLWREQQLRNGVYREGHPARNFGTGSRATLEGTTREELLAFYRQHYSADRMTLALAGAAGLDELERLARTHFGAIENRRLGPVRLPADYLPPKPALRQLTMEPIKDLRHLHLEFALPSLADTWPSKPAEAMAFVLGGEGPGSLLAQLKAEDLATSLSAGASAGAREFAAFEMQIGLTPQGLAQLPRVYALVFAAIETLRREGLPERLFAERRTLARLDELYRDKGEGAMRAVALANQVMDYGLDHAERVPFLWLRPDPEAFARLMGFLRPDNMLATLVAKGVPTDRTEPVYGTRYGYSEDAGTAYGALARPPAVPTLRLPAPNPFVPARTTLRPLEPVKLIAEPALVLHHAQDSEFQRPLAAYALRFRLPRSLATLRTAVLLRYYEACVREALNETTYTAAEAGLHFSFSASLDGVTLAAEGWDDSAGRLLDTAAAGLVDLRIDEARFAALKERLLRELAAFAKADAYLTIGETRRGVVREFHWRPDEQLAVARDIGLAQVREFARQLYARGRIEALAYGNLGARDAEQAVRRAAAVLKPAPVPEEQLLRRRLLVSPPGESLRTSETLEVNNSAWRRDAVLGPDTPEMRAAALVLAAFVEDPFYAEMRTRQQLGYIVFGGAGEDMGTQFAFFIIQSGEYPADQLEQRAEAFIATLPQQLAALPDDGWRTLLAGARAKLEEKDKSIAERATRLFDLAYERRADWSRREATLLALDALTQRRAVEVLSAALDPKTARTRTFLGFAREHRPATPPQVSFGDREAWKKTRRYE